MAYFAWSHLVGPLLGAQFGLTALKQGLLVSIVKIDPFLLQAHPRTYS